MGKDKTDTILHDSPNTKNDKKKFIEDKENSIQSNKSKGPPKFSLKVRSDLTAEVLEDENTNDSINSSNSKSNKSATSSSSTLDAKQNSSSTSSKEKHNRSTVKSSNTDAFKTENAEEENTTQFRIASNNPTGFKLRIVPLEKLLEKPPPPQKQATLPVKVPKKEKAPIERSRCLPQRRSKPVSFIQLSDSEEEEEEEEDSEISSLGSTKKGNKKRGKKATINISDSDEEEPKKSSVKGKPVQISSDSDEEEPKKPKFNKNSTIKTVDTEKEESVKFNSKRETVKNTSSGSEDVPKKSKPKNKDSRISSGSEEESAKSTKAQIAKRSKANHKLERGKPESEKDESIESVPPSGKEDEQKFDKSKKTPRFIADKLLKKPTSSDKSATENPDSKKSKQYKNISAESADTKNLKNKNKSKGELSTEKYTSSGSEDIPKKGKPKNNKDSCISSGSEEETAKSTKAQTATRSKANHNIEQEKPESEKDEPIDYVSASEKEDEQKINKSKNKRRLISLLKKPTSSDKSAAEKPDSKKSKQYKNISAKEFSESEDNEGDNGSNKNLDSESGDTKNLKKKNKSKVELSAEEDTSSGSGEVPKKSKPNNGSGISSESEEETAKSTKAQIAKTSKANKLEQEKPESQKDEKKLRGIEDKLLKKPTSNDTSATEKPDSKRSKQNKNILAKEISESEEDEEDKRSIIELKVSSDSESEHIKSLKNKNKSLIELSTDEEDQPKKTDLKRKFALKDSFEKENSDTQKIKTHKSALKRKRFENSSASEREESISSKSKKPSNGRSLLRQLSGDKVGIPSDFESDAEEIVKQTSKSKSKATTKSAPPPSPSSVRPFVVRVKRTSLSDFKDLGKDKTKRKMNGGGKSEKPSTSRRKHVSSDEDSDFDFRRAAIAEHDYDGHDVENDDNDDDDKASQNSSDSEIIPTRKRRVFRKETKNSENSDSDFEPKQKEKKKKRRIQQHSTDDSDDDKKKSNRKDIRKIIKSDDLNLSTKEAAKQEQDRRKRIEERQKLYNQIYEKPESVEVSELVLDFDTDDGSTLLEVDKGLMKKLKPHQVTGVKFMWDACFETLNDAQEKSGSGCILAHCMGLGKTMQIVTLSHTLMVNSRKTGVERVLIISPLSTLNNWAREFKHWISFTRKRNIEIFDMSKYKDKQTRIFKLNEWFEEGGVCILGYDMYRILANEKAKGLKKKQRECLQKTLVDPGPDLVVCDEGHLLKNEKTSISKAVTRMRTQRRIVLTGTPLQNNLKEYYCMIQFIKPNLLGTYKEYLNRFVNPISNGQYTDSTDRDIRLMKHRSHILHKLLEGCIQRRDYSVLAPYLPPKHEYVVYTTLSILQQLLYEHYMVHQRDLNVNSTEGKGAKLFQDFQELRRIWTHPMNMRINSDSVIRKKILANESDSMEDFICDDDKDEDGADSTSDTSDDSSKSFSSQVGAAAPSKVVKTRNFRRKFTEEGVEVESDIEEEPTPQQDDPSEWWKRFVADKELNNLNHSPKLVMLMRLLEQCEAIGDKLLVFSQSLQSLDTIEHFLSLLDNKTRGYEYEGDVGDLKGFWKPGTDYFRLDGSCSVEQRESMCKQFNDASNLRARLFLISTRAGGLGINLVSANRVVIFDVSWNPSHDTQSIFRVYRFGQIKPCYIYRLIAMGTMEQKLYERQVAKQATAKRVIDEQQISRHYNQSDLQELYTYELTPSVPREIPILPKDRLFAELLSEHETLLFKYHEHDSLLENEESENLSAEERKAAWSEYEAEKTRAVQTAQYVAYDRSAYGQYGNASGSVTSNKIFGFRSDVLLQLLNMKIAKDHPEMTQNQVIQVVPTYLNQLYSQMNSGDPSMYKDLLSLHGTLTHPSGMYMNPLLYVNQNPSAAGYFQTGGQPPANGVGVAPMVGGPPVMMPGVVPMMGIPMGIVPQPAPPVAAPGFDPNEVYEID